MSFLYFSLIGVALLLIGIWVRTGGFKTFYLAKGIPVLMPRAIQNMFIPLGVMFIVWGIIWSNFVPDIEIGNKLFDWVVTPLMVISIVLGIWNPRWLRPRWLNYLEDEYGTIMWHLLGEASKDAPAWTRRVHTHEGLVEWAEETRIKLGYPQHPGQIERQAKEQKRKG